MNPASTNSTAYNGTVLSVQMEAILPCLPEHGACLVVIFALYCPYHYNISELQPFLEKVMVLQPQMDVLASGPQTNWTEWSFSFFSCNSVELI